eukprot:TRINITY_DN66893_c6_g1_i3.p2 TRINITY_DN66893_c6_g1~~TRINITY_DN66893_c6_g1_i3.p2  ORF type:complete len:182 (+),score=12.42 TRINITY_DN66893_c6_g1_i3:158-703(+)
MHRLCCFLFAFFAVVSCKPWTQVLDARLGMTIAWEKVGTRVSLCFEAQVPNSDSWAAIGFKTVNKTIGYIEPAMADSDIVVGMGGYCNCVGIRRALARYGYPAGSHVLQIYKPEFVHHNGTIGACFSRDIVPKHGTSILTDNAVVIYAIGPMDFNGEDMSFHGLKNRGNTTINWLTGPAKN